MKRRARAVTTLITLLLMLISLIFGAIISYLWVLAPFSDMPQNATWVIVEEVDFPLADANHINVTLHNLLNSVSDVNITTIRISVEATSAQYFVTASTPLMPYLLARGNSTTFNCETNWGDFEGQVVRVEPVVTNASIVSKLVVVPKVELTLTPEFNADETVNSFNLSVANAADSVTNVTLTSILFSTTLASETINQTTPSLPYVVAPGENITFVCTAYWGSMLGRNATIEIATAEGFAPTNTTSELPGASLYVNDVVFGNQDSSYFNLSIGNFLGSTTAAVLSQVNLTLSNGTVITPSTLPALNTPFPVLVGPNSTTNIRVEWNWTSYRNQSVTVSTYTKQGITVPSVSAVTPPNIVWNVTGIDFDLADTSRFSVNFTNFPVSIQAINVTEVSVNGTASGIAPLILNPGEQGTLGCVFNWTSFIDQNANVTVRVTYDSNELAISTIVKVPFLDIVNVTFGSFDLGNPYVNVTVQNSQYSDVNATLFNIFVQSGNASYQVQGNLTQPPIYQGYQLLPGQIQSVICPFFWDPYRSTYVTITLETVNGIRASRTVFVPSS